MAQAHGVGNFSPRGKGRLLARHLNGDPRLETSLLSVDDHIHLRNQHLRRKVSAYSSFIAIKYIISFTFIPEAPGLQDLIFADGVCKIGPT